MSVLVVTGTGTGVGKTVVSAAVCSVSSASAVHYVKAAQTGVPGDEPDVDVVRRLAAPTSTVEGGRFPDPLSPHTAARRAGLPPVDLARVAGIVRSLDGPDALVVVEGAGGLLVRFDETGATVADLAAMLDAPVLVVAAAGLGTLNATTLTLEALAARGLGVAGVVVGSWPADPGLAERCNLADLEDLGAGPLAGALPAGAGTLDREAFRAVALASLHRDPFG